MGYSQIRDWTGRPPGADEPVFDLTVSKLLRPLVRPGTIPRPALVERLAAGDPRPIVSVTAPPGYGKTTLLSQWAEHDDQAFAWVSVDAADNDPKVLLTYIAEALNAIEPIGRRVFDALASPVSSVPGSVVPRLGSAFSSLTSPVVLILDDVHTLGNSECRAALSVLADHVPNGSRLVLAGRAGPPLRVARLRAEGKLLEIGPQHLSLTRTEAASLLRNAGVVLGEDEIAELHRRTEGWPAGLYLAALYLREGGSLPHAAVSFGGDDRLVSEYMESEFLARISQRQRVFLTRTAVLDRMCAPLCEAVLGLPGAGPTLADLAGSNMLLVPLDRRGQWYRYHHLFRDMLVAELERLEPELIPVLRSRAADWCSRNGLPEAAMEYAVAAGDVETAARQVTSLWLPLDRQGRTATLQRWFRWLEAQGGIESRPMLAVQGAFVAATMGRPAEAERLADLVDRWQCREAGRAADPVTEAWAAVLRASQCRRGVEQMRADSDEAVRRTEAENIVAPVARLLQGFARILCGDPDGGDLMLADAASAAESVGAHEVGAITLSQRSLVAMARGDWHGAAALAGQADAILRRAGIVDTYAVPLVCAATARVAWHRGDAEVARRELVSAQRLRPVLTYAIPHAAVQVRIELARVHLALGDLTATGTLLREIDELFKRIPGLGTLVGEAQALRAQLGKERAQLGDASAPSVPGASALTTAELRLLPLLSTHLSFPEIAAELFLSPHTIKSQATSIYRKLGVSSRSEAVARSRELTLLRS